MINKYVLRGFKFSVTTSRSDAKLVYESFASEAVCRLQDVPIEAKSVIVTYLKTGASTVCRTCAAQDLGLFINAATVVEHSTPVESITVGEQTEMLHDFLSKLTSASDATSLVDGLYRQIMCASFSKLSGKVFSSSTAHPFCVRLNGHLLQCLSRMAITKLRGQSARSSRSALYLSRVCFQSSTVKIWHRQKGL